MNFSGWREVTIGDVSQYSIERINAKKLTLGNYVSTKNMLPDKAGKTIATFLPGGRTFRFRPGQTLVSNVRPYLKKIWYADTEGGCSGDVLVFDTSTEVNDKYFYYLLNQDNFFDYVMRGSKGTKMPRGDKQQIMMYPFKLPPSNEQKAIVETLSCLDDKIELNNRINKTLEEMAQAIFKSWFIDFEPFQDGEFENSEFGRIPKGWRVGTLGEITSVSSGKRPPIKSDILNAEMDIPVVESNRIKAYTNNCLYDEKVFVIGREYTHGIIQRFRCRCWPSESTLVVKSQRYEYVYQIFCSINYTSLNKGLTRPLISQKDIKNFMLIIPANKVLDDFEEIISPLMDVYDQNNIQNKTLKDIRNTLLPKLMSGEIRVPLEN